MFRTQIATSEDIDNATFFASGRLDDLLRGEIDRDGWDDPAGFDIDLDADSIRLS